MGRSHLQNKSRLEPTLLSFLVHENPEFREQAFHVVRNVADSQPGIEMVFEHLGSARLLGALSDALESPNDGVVRQVSITRALVIVRQSYFITGCLRSREPRQ